MASRRKPQWIRILRQVSCSVPNLVTASELVVEADLEEQWDFMTDKQWWLEDCFAKRHCCSLKSEVDRGIPGD